MGITEIIEEIQRLDGLYKHYKRLYKKYRLLCCSSERGTIRKQRDFLKSELEKKREELVRDLFKSERNNQLKA